MVPDSYTGRWHTSPAYGWQAMVCPGAESGTHRHCCTTQGTACPSTVAGVIVAVNVTFVTLVMARGDAASATSASMGVSEIVNSPS
jgi:hypothetical protein